MISTASTRARRSTMATVIAVGLLATVGVDIAQAASNGGSSAPAAVAHHDAPSTGASAEQAYLAALRPIAIQVHNAVAPVAKVTDAIITPHPGDDAAARDALIHGEGLSGVRAARTQLAKLHAPAPLAKDQASLLDAAKGMQTALKNARGLSSATGLHLFAAIQRFGAGNFASSQGSWQLALDDAYSKGSMKAPAGLDGRHLAAPVSRTAWIFSADRACSASTYRLGNISKLANERSVSGFVSYNHRWESTLLWLNHKLVGLHHPTGSSALPLALTSRIKVLKFTAKTNGRIAKALGRHSESATQHGLDQLTQLASPLRILGTEFNRYGAKSCGAIVQMYGGKKIATTHHSASTVNT
jgi:hypothetical protein